MEDDKPEKVQEIANPAIDYVIERLAYAFGYRTAQDHNKFKEFWAEIDKETQNKRVKYIQTLLYDEMSEFMIVQSSASNLGSFSMEPQTSDWIQKGRKAVVILKLIDLIDYERQPPIGADNMHQVLIFMELTRDTLTHMHGMFKHIFMPLLHNEQNSKQWTELVSKDLIEKFNNYLAQTYVTMGQIRGQTQLPCPPHKLTQGEQISEKDKAHVFEGCVIMWTKQIKNILKLEPEQALKHGNPNPLVEIQFWKNKSENLDSIHQQLQSEQVKKILKFLLQSKSTYHEPFKKLEIEVKAAKIEANDSYAYVAVLEDWFERLLSTSDFKQLHLLFVPIMHIILMIWKESKYYNTPSRLVVLIREICNAIIELARQYVSGAAIFADLEEDPFKASEKLQTTIDICTKFKDAYFEYKGKADNQWQLTTNALFVRLDNFLERCHDILDLTKTITQFNKLENIWIGGTKGKTLTETVNAIFEKFQEAVDTFKSVSYDIMDIDEREFDTDFYKFRNNIKELERRLASVLTQGFDDSDTIFGRFKLLDSFESLLNRPHILDELEKKHIILIESYKQDLKQIQIIFTEGKELCDKLDEHNPIFRNMPPVAGTLTWTRGLKERIKETYTKLKEFSSAITDREEFKDAAKLYNSLNKNIEEYENSKRTEWETEIEGYAKEKLKLNILARDEDDLLKVNFDPDLIRMLREIKYFKLLDIAVPETADNIYKSNDKFRVQITSLGIIVGQYNWISTCLHPVERPLIQSKIEEMNAVLKTGIEELKWEDSDQILEFVKKTKNIVLNVNIVVDTMKDSLSKINLKLDNDIKETLSKHQDKKKAMKPDDFYQEQQATMQDKHQQIKGNYKEISKNLKEISDVIKVNKASNVWVHYREYINDIIIKGQVNAIMESLNGLLKRIAYTKGKEFEHQIFELNMELSNKMIVYDPAIEEHPDREKQTVRNSVLGWIKDFFHITTLFQSNQRMDLQQGDYLTEIRDSFEIRGIMSKITVNLDLIEEDCQQFIRKFNHFSDLWAEEPEEAFEKFLKEQEKEMDAFAEAARADDLSESEEQGNMQALEDHSALLKGAKARTPPLEIFDERITDLEKKKKEIMALEDTATIGWLKIYVSSLRSSLQTKVDRWINVYTDFLLNQVKTILANLQNFNKNTAEGILKNPKDHVDDKKLLQSVMQIISDVHELTPQVEVFVEKIKLQVLLLKAHNVNLDDHKIDIVIIDHTKQEFNGQRQKVLSIKEEIYPLQQKEGVRIKNQQKEFTLKLKEFYAEFMKTMPFGFPEDTKIEHIQHAYNQIDEYRQKVRTIILEGKKLSKEVLLFGIERTKKKEIKICRKHLKSLKLFWDSIALVTYNYEKWKQQPWQQISIDLLQETNKSLGLQVKKLPKEVRIKPFFHKQLTQKVKDMQTFLPMIENLLNPAMKARHWTTLLKMAGKDIDVSAPTTTFEDILKLQLYKFEAQVNDTVDLAQKEQKIDKQIKDIKRRWNRMNFEFKSEKNVPSLDKIDDLTEFLDNDQMLILSLSAQGRFVVNFKDELDQWRQTLEYVSETIDIWMKMQKTWARLVNIFLDAEDIRAQLSEETKIFEEIDGEWREYQSNSENNPAVIDSCTKTKILILQGWFQKIEKCEKALKDYLEVKKKVFPRFYFLPDDTLLDVLSNGKYPVKVAKYLKACFQALTDLEFCKEPAGKIVNRAYGMYDGGREYVKFSNGDDEVTIYQAGGEVEQWLTDLELMMKLSLYVQLGQARETARETWETIQSESKKTRDKWIEEYCSQISLIITLVVWTEETQNAIMELENGTETAMKDYHLVTLDRINQLILRVRGELTKIIRQRFITVITVDVHGRDVVSDFKTRVPPIEGDSFDWQKQLRYYYRAMEPYELSDQNERQFVRYPWEKTEDEAKCFISIVDWRQFYGFEYIGNVGRLVITQLTDRCYITLTQALNLKMGGAPAGPAGTGKTETTKDLGGAIGLPVLVTNCSDQMTTNSCAQFFMGLCQCGAWGCFDEFNRISIEVLSVVSTQVSQILNAMKTRQQHFTFQDDDELVLQDTVGFFITMNPGYAGRTELPENLKAQFRSCAMVVPDFVPICENMLMAEGFGEAFALARKFICLYQLSNDLLSQQKHYDWGLRAIKSVLRQAGGLLRKAAGQRAEQELLMTGLLEFNIAKILTDDQPIFIRLIEDLFPGIKYNKQQDFELEKKIKAASQSLGYQAEEGFVLKVIQTKEILVVRHCMFLIGPPGSGKTATWKTLAKANCLEGEDNVCQIINPKSVNPDELFGYMTKAGEWCWGVMSTVMDHMSQAIEAYKNDQAHKWIILDGIVDTLWIESLNTVMDDNKVLTLVSNARIPLTDSMRLLFEVANLENATLATVTRGGVLYINSTDIGWKPYMDSWLDRSKYKVADQKATQNSIFKVPKPIDDIANSIFQLAFQKFFTENYRYFELLKYVAPTNQVVQVMATCAIIDALLDEHFDKIKDLEKKNKELAYEQMFLFAVMWGIGGAVGGGEDGLKAQKDFHSNFRMCSQKVRFPEEEGTIAYDYWYNVELNSWSKWEELVPVYEHPEEDFLFSKILVHSIQTTRLNKLCEYHIERRKPVLFIGSSGTGKTVVLNDFLKKNQDENMKYQSIMFNSYTDAPDVQLDIEAKIDKKTKNIYGLPGGQILVYFVDDLNMPSGDQFNTQTPIELLRQIHDSGEIFDRDHCEEKKVLTDVLIFGCQNPKAGSFTIDLRLQRHFTVFAFMVPDDTILTNIYKKILGGHIEQFDGKPFADLSTKIVRCLIIFYNKIINDTTHFSPSGVRFTYQFNLREISKVIEGILQSKPNIYKGNDGARDIRRLFVHECKRVFSDRLVLQEHMDIMAGYLTAAMGGDIWDGETIKEASEEPNIFTPFIYERKHGEFQYMPITGWDELKLNLEEKLTEHNETNIVMNLVLFKEAMRHVCKIIRILYQPGGNPLLVGVGGSGKQSLARLAAFILGYETASIVVTAQFKLVDLETELQELFKNCTKPSAQPRCFKITDQQIINERFLIYINNMLSTGYCPGIFAKEDLLGLSGNLRNEAKGNGIIDTPGNIQEYWFDVLKSNMHVILCFSPVGNTFRVRARKFPGIINNTMIDYFHAWPKEALISVAGRYLKDTDLASDELRENIALNMAEVHLSINEANKRFLRVERRHNYTTPKSFLEFKDYYKILLAQKRGFIVNQIIKLEKGLDTLSETNKQVTILKEEITEISNDVDIECKNTEVLIQNVGEKNEIAEREAEAAGKQAIITNKLSSAAEKIEREATEAFKSAVPILKAAEEALKCLSKADIGDMKGFGKPADAVRFIMKCVMIMRGQKFKKGIDIKDDKMWKKGTVMMGNPTKFLEEILSYDGKNIAEHIKVTMKEEIAWSEKNICPFDDQIYLKKGCLAASKLCLWVKSILQFNEVFLFVKPLEEKKEAALKEKTEKQAELADIMEKVAELKAQVAELTKTLDEAVLKKDKVELKAKQCQEKLDSANSLVQGLAGENERWKINVQSLKKATELIVGDALFAAAFVSYIPAFSQPIRTDLNIQWMENIIAKKIPLTEGIEPLDILTNPSEMAQWNNENLPNDPMSLQNAAVISACKRWPLLIDPQLQGIGWIRGHCGENLTIMTFDTKNWMMQLKNQIMLGQTVMFEQITDHIDPTLDPLLQRQITMQGTGYEIDLGGSAGAYDMQFQLYLQTKMLNPHFPPELAASCTIINFIVTESGLEEQLLAMVVTQEMPQLEQQRQALVKNQNDYQVQLARLEEELLNALEEADPATILDNVALIQKLDETKQTSVIIENKQKEAVITQVTISRERELYRPVAAEGSMLYFLIIQLCVISHMYQYSLESFQNFFFKAMEETIEKGDKRVGALRLKIRYIIYQWISRGLNTDHKIIFLTLIVFRLMQKKVIEIEYEQADMDFLINCIPKVGAPNPLSDWLPDANWNYVQRLVGLPRFATFSHNLVSDAPTRFKDWYNELSPENQKLPLEWKSLESQPFQKLLVLRCLRPDRVEIALKAFIKRVLPEGDTFVDMDMSNGFPYILEESFNNVLSNPSIPLFFILSTGADPTQDIINFGEKLGFMESNKKFSKISLGQGVEQTALQKLNESFKQGLWILLQNIHLMPTFLGDLEKQLELFQANTGSGSPNFRLLLSAKPSQAIPIGILDKSIKLTNEPPTGLRANMQRAWTFFPDTNFDDKDVKLKSILFALCYFHSCAIERQRFGKKGWNMNYPFSLGDLRDSSIVLHKYIDKMQSGTVPWIDLRYIFGEIMYGGHIVNGWDRVLCNAYQEQFMCDALIQDELDLFPFADGKKYSFKCPSPTSYHKYLDHIKQLKEETPIAYGLHPNAEIDFRTEQCKQIFQSLSDLMPKEAGEEEDEGKSTVATPNEVAAEIKDKILDDMAIADRIINVQEIKDQLPQRKPYQNVFIQECQSMNILLQEIVVSLRALDLGLKGQLTISDNMEILIKSLSLGRVPVTWQNKAYPSERGLSSWLINLGSRIDQLDTWKMAPDDDAKLVYINRLFNPQSFLTAIMQVAGSQNAWELNKLKIKTDITNKSAEEVDQPPPKNEGAYIFGMFVEGARYDLNNRILEDSFPKEMFSIVPVIWCKAYIFTEGRPEKFIYQCPVYKTVFRGPTYVFTAQIPTKKMARKWILAGVACIMDVDGVSEIIKKK